jgi:mannose-6-phosphate isomerase-like protein (cupin superfamily)
MIIEKPWGYEVIWAKDDVAGYVGKELFIGAGKRLSQQYHKFKVETLRVVQGRVKVYFFGDMCNITREPSATHFLISRMSLHIPNGVVHRIEALVDSSIIEVSSREIDDVVRLEDDYGRK